jgi:exonuclease III
MKIATFDVNRIKARLPALLQWLEEIARPTWCASRNSRRSRRTSPPPPCATPATAPSGKGRNPGTAWPSCRAATIPSRWDDLRQRWPRNAGLRQLLHPAAALRLEAAGVDREVRGRERPSDHAPVWVTLG